ncbi:DNA repair and recombination protein RadA [Methanococcus maripaludis]|uniref:DNA repair and recombination protein RadA n=2 Tax=Methanococcus maripaludis TaxID=39152 RepID=RADA_METM7|nr:DNA repair and recombination protein RadA [Methanococcus maripaludis]A6VGG2.1 RecName: Full=DNA repair and recombination protein RadA [Methanococcus maripaludis C7]MBA2861189.1 DNA repair protein RadA [Methanococcus maripaludis]
MADVLTELPGVGPSTAEKLIEAGYLDFMKIATATIGELTDIEGISEKAAAKMIMAARDLCDLGFKSGVELLRQRQSVWRLSTGSKELDTVLAGGLESQSVTEFAGMYGSGKTQIMHQSCVNLQIAGKIYADLEGVVEEELEHPKAVYIDTEGTFRPERVVQMAEGLGIDGQLVLDNTFVARAYNSDMQMLFAEKIEDLIKGGNNIKLVIIDSLTSTFRNEFTGRGKLAERQQKLGRHMATLNKLADLYNCIVLVTNQVAAKPDAFFGVAEQAIGGHVVGHAATFRFFLRKSKGDKRVAKLYDSPHLPDSEAVFRITEKGIMD